MRYLIASQAATIIVCLFVQVLFAAQLFVIFASRIKLFIKINSRDVFESGNVGHTTVDTV